MKISPFATLKHLAQQIFLATWTVYFLQLLKTNLLSETTISQTQPAFVCLNSANINSRIMCEICLKLTIERPDAIPVSSLLTFNTFDTLF